MLFRPNPDETTGPRRISVKRRNCPDVNGNYEPSNCRSAYAFEQTRNKRFTASLSVAA
jgi:hypothetical protein